MAIDAGSTGFIIICMALVNFMTPGLAFFYGGLVRQQNVLTMIMQNFVSMGIVTMIWIVWGFSLCFGKSGKLIGDPSSYAMLSNIEDMDGAIPGVVFAGTSHPPSFHTALRNHETITPPESLVERFKSSTSSSVARARQRQTRRSLAPRRTRARQPSIFKRCGLPSPRHFRDGTCFQSRF